VVDAPDNWAAPREWIFGAGQSKRIWNELYKVRRLDQKNLERALLGEEIRSKESWNELYKVSRSDRKESWNELYMYKARRTDQKNVERSIR
jgi:hypothetical protein